MKKSHESLESNLKKLREKELLELKKHNIQGVYEVISPDFVKIMQQNPNNNQDYKVIKPISLPGLLSTAYKEAEAELGKRPCDYAVMGFGSMSRQEATTFSDFEFGIIVDSSKPSKVKLYFKKLTQLVREKIIQLGESGLEKKGVRFDSWDKTPLAQNLDLINNKAGFLKYLRNKDNETLSKDILLHMMLCKTCFVYGQVELFKDYYKAAGATLTLEYKTGNSRYVEMLYKDRTEYLNPNNQDTKIAKAAQAVSKQYKASLDNLKAFLDKPKEISLDVKVDIYRSIQSAIELFAGAKGWFQESMFQLPHRLAKNHHIDEDTKNLMLKCANFAGELRLEINEVTQGAQNSFLLNEFLRNKDIHSELQLHYDNACELLGFINDNISH